MLQKALGGGCILNPNDEIDYAIWLLGKPRTLFVVGDNLSKLKIDEDSTQILLNNQSEEKNYQFRFTNYLQTPSKRYFNIVMIKELLNVI